jgi:hypothetical protein
VGGVLAVPLELRFRLGGQRERRVRAVLLADEVLGEPADRGPAGGVHAHEADRLHARGAVRVGELEDGEHLDRRADRRDLVADRAVQDGLPQLGRGGGEAVGALGVHDDIGDVAVEAVAELGAEPAHDGVDDDERGDAEHDADDADEREVAGAEVAGAEEELVHGFLPGAGAG